MNQAAFVIIKRENKVLLVRSSTNPKYALLWGLPGGVVEAGESLQFGARREAIEETNITCTIDNELSSVYNAEGKIQVHVFAGKYLSGEILIDTSEIEEAKWVTITEAMNLPLSFNTKELLEDLYEAV